MSVLFTVVALAPEYKALGKFLCSDQMTHHVHVLTGTRYLCSSEAPRPLSGPLDPTVEMPVVPCSPTALERFGFNAAAHKRQPLS